MIAVTTCRSTFRALPLVDFYLLHSHSEQNKVPYKCEYDLYNHDGSSFIFWGGFRRERSNTTIRLIVEQYLKPTWDYPNLPGT